jgi:AIR synthase related protein, C-terminal domain
MAVTGTADPAALLRTDAGQPALPLSLTKPIGTGVLNAWHKATGQVSVAAVDVMTTLNAGASRLAVAAGIRCTTDVTGFGLLGHLFKLARASGVSAVVDHAAVLLIEGSERRRGRGICLAGAGGTWNGCCRIPTPARCARKSCCCSRTRRPRAGCWWPGAAGRGDHRGAGPAARQRAHHPVAPDGGSVSAGRATSPGSVRGNDAVLQSQTGSRSASGWGPCQRSVWTPKGGQFRPA